MPIIAAVALEESVSPAPTTITFSWYDDVAVPAALVAVIVYPVAAAMTVGVPEIRPVVVLKLKPGSVSAGEIA